MKKIVAFIIGIVIVLAVVGCGGSQDKYDAAIAENEQLKEQAVQLQSEKNSELTQNDKKTHFILNEVEFDIKDGWEATEYVKSEDYKDEKTGYTITLPDKNTIDVTYTPKIKEFEQWDVPEAVMVIKDEPVEVGGHSGWETVSIAHVLKAEVQMESVKIDYNGNIYTFSCGYTMRDENISVRSQMDKIIETVEYK